MAEQVQIERLRRSVLEWNEWRRQQPEIRPNLSDAFLLNADLNHADLRDAYLIGTDLSLADLSNADLSGASLRYTNLTEAYLRDANLTGASLNFANLSNADLTGANLNQARLGYTIFAWVDLSTINGLETVTHEGPSSIDVITVKLPQKETRTRLLRGAGIPESFIDYLPSLLATAIQYHSLFLSCSHHDEIFTKRLYDDLQNSGVRCWFAPHDLRPGTPLVRGIEDAIHLHEKLLLILSKDAVTSNWVQQEVETALYKEVTTGQEILFPIRLDNMILESDTLWAKRLRQRHIGDFTGWQDNVAYQRAFITLLRHLKVTQLPTNSGASS